MPPVLGGRSTTINVLPLSLVSMAHQYDSSRVGWVEYHHQGSSSRPDTDWGRGGLGGMAELLSH